MAYNPAHWTVTRSTGAIRYIGPDHGAGGESYSTIIDFYRNIQDLADDAVSVGDDELDITDINPAQRSTDNIITLLGIYNIDDNAAEHLYDGSITQGSGGTEEIYDGIVNFGNADIQLQLHQNGAVLSDDWWNQAGVGLNPSLTQGISHRFIIKTRSGGVDIDGRRLLGTNRRSGFTAGEFPINGTARGNNVLALKDSDDINDDGSGATYTDITNLTEGHALLDVAGDGSADEPYYSEWDIASRTINQFYQRMKYITRDGSGFTIYGLNGELFRGITHEIPVDTKSGVNFAAFELVNFPAGTAQMLAVDSVSAPTKMWVQLLTGIAPSNNDAIDSDGTTAACLVNGPVVSRTVVAPFVGQSTGSAIIGAYGVGIQAADLLVADSVKTLDDVSVGPPNNVPFVVSGVASGDRVLVGPYDGSTLDANGNPAIEVNQLSLSTALTGAAETAVVVTAAIPADTPSAGDIRIQLASGNYKEVPYTSYSGSTFVIASTDFSSDNAASSNNVWIAYIDATATGVSESFTSVYLADRDLVVLVRDGGVTPIKEFITSAVLGSSPSGVTAIRTSDE